MPGAEELEGDCASNINLPSIASAGHGQATSPQTLKRINLRRTPPALDHRVTRRCSVPSGVESSDVVVVAKHCGSSRSAPRRRAFFAVDSRCFCEILLYHHRPPPPLLLPPPATAPAPAESTITPRLSKHRCIHTTTASRRVTDVTSSAAILSATTLFGDQDGDRDQMVGGQRAPDLSRVLREEGPHDR